jgi:hypothetical protein
MASTPAEILERLRDQFAVIRKEATFQTDIGAQIYLNALQRPGNKLPSIAIGTVSGELNRTDEALNGKSLSRRARRLDLTIEAAMKSKPEDYLVDGLAMLEDIEQAWSKTVSGVMAPVHTGVITLDSWKILDRPDGIDATVLQISGTATYTRAA